MWNDLFAAIALLLVFEGIMPSLSPAKWRQAICRIAEMPDSALRMMGLTSMLAGAALLYVIR